MTDFADPMVTDVDAPLAYPPEKRCTAQSKQAGRRCRQPVVPGASVCHWHGGRSPQAIRKAQDRLQRARVEGELSNLADQLADGDDQDVDPIELLNLAMATSRRMVGLTETLTLELADLHGPDHLGDLRPHPLVKILAEWTDLAARTSSLAARAGIEERRVRVEEEKVDLVAGVVLAAMATLGELHGFSQDADETRCVLRHYFELAEGVEPTVALPTRRHDVVDVAEFIPITEEYPWTS